MTEVPTEALQQAIRDRHGCGSRFVRSVTVTVTGDGRTYWQGFHGTMLWEGEVQVFDLVDHPTATRAYAWARSADGPDGADGERLVVVLHAGAVDAPEAAVRAALAAEARARH